MQTDKRSGMTFDTAPSIAVVARIVAATGVLLAQAAPGSAADLTPVPGTVIVEEPAAANESPWEFAAAAYVWGASLSGSVGVGRLGPADVDMSFGDLLSELDFAFMGAAEARYGRFGVLADIVYADLSADGSGPRGRVDANLDNGLFIGTLMAEGRLLEQGKTSLDLMAGGRLWNVTADLTLSGPRRSVSSSLAEAWVDPMIGAKTRLQGDLPFFLTGWGMIGGFGAGSEFSWDVFAGVGYEINDKFSVIGGYRGLGVDYDRDGFLFDVIQHGPLVSGVYRF